MREELEQEYVESEFGPPKPMDLTRAVVASPAEEGGNIVETVAGHLTEAARVIAEAVTPSADGELYELNGAMERPLHHGLKPQRGMEAAAEEPAAMTRDLAEGARGVSNVPTNRFGYLFQELRDDPANLLPPGPGGTAMQDGIVAVLDRLAKEMKDTPANPSADNPTIPAGFTYLGQFIDHDITFDLTPQGMKLVDPKATFNFRTPGVNLDNVYGAGPGGSPYLFENPRFGNMSKMVLGDGEASNPPGARPGFDLQRTSQGIAIIGDPRNDENLVVAQLQVAFIKFHNAVVDKIQGGRPPNDPNVFAEASNLVRWHYQWIVAHEYLEEICMPAIVADVRAGNFKAYDPNKPFIPVEFSVGAFRFGHSMVREDYSHNRFFGPPGAATPNRIADATLDLLFAFTQGPVPTNWEIDWHRFFDFGDGKLRNRSRKIDTKLVPQLFNLPDGAGSLAERNLHRSYRMRVPSGQSIAAKLGATVLTPAQLKQSPALANPGTPNRMVLERTPLWYYILREAEVQQNGERLGEVGSRIVAEVLIGLMFKDKSSFFAQPGWKPTLGPTAGQFRMKDMLKIAGF